MVEVPVLKCRRCGYQWIPRLILEISPDDEPIVSFKAPKWCHKCKSPYWDRDRRVKK